uniref:E3 ubiquitin-protein ligase listerin n=1 Tax=Gongylonema pulchrum TaxID=637853 RepID=A0A183F1R4_9BILA
LMWARNIERHMEGAEDCVICLMTVHSVTYQLPRVRCKQCKKRFHSECLVGFTTFISCFYSFVQ